MLQLSERPPGTKARLSYTQSLLLASFSKRWTLSRDLMMSYNSLLPGGIYPFILGVSNFIFDTKTHILLRHQRFCVRLVWLFMVICKLNLSFACIEFWKARLTLHPAVLGWGGRTQSQHSLYIINRCVFTIPPPPPNLRLSQDDIKSEDCVKLTLVKLRPLYPCLEHKSITS